MKKPLLCASCGRGWGGARAARPGLPANRAAFAGRRTRGPAAPPADAPSMRASSGRASDCAVWAASSRRRPHRSRPRGATCGRSGGPGGARSASRKSGPNAEAPAPAGSVRRAGRERQLLVACCWLRVKGRRAGPSDWSDLSDASDAPTGRLAWHSRCRHGGRRRRPSRASGPAALPLH